MAGLGRGLGALLSESCKAAKKRDDKDVSPSYAEDILRRSMSSTSEEAMTEAAGTAEDMVDSVSSHVVFQAAAPSTAVEAISPDPAQPQGGSVELQTATSAVTPQQESHHKEVLQSVTAELKELSKTTSDTLDSTKEEANPSVATISFASAPAAERIALNNSNTITVPEEHVVHNILLSKIRPASDQPRKEFDEDALKELSASIQEHGLLEPLLVKRTDSGHYEIICGERRYRAAYMAHLPAVPCLVRDFTPEKSSAIALIENIQRENLNPLEQAVAFKKMMKEHNMTQDALAKSLGKPRSVISNFIRLLGLEDVVKQHLRDGHISLGHAKVLLAIKGPRQVELCNEIIGNSLNVRETEKMVKAASGGSSRKNTLRKTSAKSKSTVRFKSYEEQIKERMPGVRAKFTITGSSRGRLVLSYANATELRAVLATLGVSEVEPGIHENEEAEMLKGKLTSPQEELQKPQQLSAQDHESEDAPVLVDVTNQ